MIQRQCVLANAIESQLPQEAQQPQRRSFRTTRTHRTGLSLSLLLLMLLALAIPTILHVSAQSSSSSSSSSYASPIFPSIVIPTVGPIDDAQCNIEDLEMANDSQLHTILWDLKQTAFFRNFFVDLDHKCPLQSWTKKKDSGDEGGGEEEEFQCSGGAASFELDEGAEPLCTVDTAGGSADAGIGLGGPLDSNALTFLQAGGFQSQAQKDTFAWSKHSDLVVDGSENSCDKESYLLPDSFWMDMCSNIKTEAGTIVNLAVNPEHNTGYNGTHIWKAIYEENCIAAGDSSACLEDRVLYRMLSGLHSSTTLSIAIHYYAPSKRKGRENWEPNPQYFMSKFENHPEHLLNLHFAFVVLLRALGKASPFLYNYEFRTGNIVEDETATILLRRLLDSSVLGSCASVFDSFDESLLWKGKDIKLKQSFKGVFHNVSSILDCVQCQQCKLHGKMTMLGYGAALKVLFMKNSVLERNEIVALINTIAKFSESLKHIRELTHLYWTSHQQQSKSAVPAVPAVASSSSSATSTASSPIASSSSSSSSYTSPAFSSNTDLVDKAVHAVATLGRNGRINLEHEAQLVKWALERKEELLILAKHYAGDLDKFWLLSQSILLGGSSSGSSSGATVAAGEPPLPDAVIVGSGLAGLAAALNILDRGGHVVVVEKEHLLGGNSNKASSGINACCLEEDNTTDTLDLFRNDTTRSAGTSARPELIDTLVTRSGAAVSWLKNRVGVDLSLLSQLGGHSSKRTHRPSNGMAGAEIIYHLQKAVRSYEKTGKVKILVDTKVEGLLTDDTGRVIGVNTKSTTDNSESEVRGDNVVLASGGFAADRSTGSFLDRHRPELLKMATTAGAFSTGDGVSLATALGAGTVDMDKVQIHPTGWVDPADPENTSKVLAAELMRGVGGILLNSKGERFCNELGTRSYVTEKMLSHDPSYAETGKWNPKAKVPTFYLVLSSSAAKDGKKHVDLYRHKGLMTKVKGVTELAKLTGTPSSILVSTLKKYQQSAINGKDEFGKTSFRGVPQTDLDSEVFFVGMITPVLHYCMGGITIDKEGNVLKETGEKIPGLHAAGEVTGGVHGVNRLGGNSLLECTVYGTIVGQKLPVKVPPNSTQSPSTQVQSQTTETGGAELRPVTLSELQKHNNPDDCWVSIHDVVYDLTAFAEEHPAGAQAIHGLAGKNGTEAFAAVHNEGMMDDFLEDRKGRLVLSPPK